MGTDIDKTPNQKPPSIVISKPPSIIISKINETTPEKRLNNYLKTLKKVNLTNLISKNI